MKTVVTIGLKAIRYFLLGGILSFLLLLYLVITDPYFEKLDWKAEGFAEKISEYHIYTVYIPMAFIAVYGIYSILLSKNKHDKMISGSAVFLAFILFTPIDIKIKYYFIMYQEIVVNIAAIIVFYVIVLFTVSTYVKQRNNSPQLILNSNMLEQLIKTYGELCDSIVTSMCYKYGDVMSPAHILPSIEVKAYCYNKDKADYENICISLTDVYELQLNDNIYRQIFAVKDALISDIEGGILLDFNPIDHFTHLEENPDSRFKVKCKSLKYSVIE